MASKLTRRWIGQMALNAMLMAAVFIGAVFVEQRPPGLLRNLGLGTEGLKTVLWLVAVIISLPMFIATFKKLQALGLLIAETKVTAAAAGERAAAIRAIVAQVIPIAGTAALGLYVLILSSTLLPPLRVLIALLVVVGLITALLWRGFVKIYSKAQVALQETLAQPPAPRAEKIAPPLPSILREANLATANIAPGSPAAGKLLRELQLRTRTGVSIIGIERNGISMVNPSPDEELQPGDQVLLLGTRAQLDAGRRTLMGAA
jgi:CPA2 family monovalent cation:H+ antiporter-2